MFGANLQGSKILATDLTGSDLSETNLQDTSFEITDLTDANLSDANLRRAQFEFLDISNANLKGVDLENSTFCEVNLSDSDLRSASLKGSHITETIIENIRLNQGAQIFPVNLAGIESADEYDKLARTTHDLGKAAKKNGLLRKARNLRIQERKARQSEAYENRDFRTYLGSLISEWVIGYGIGI